jgi:hypothetical protein
MNYLNNTIQLITMNNTLMKQSKTKNNLLYFFVSLMFLQKKNI